MAKLGLLSRQAGATDHLPFRPLSPQHIRVVLDAFRMAWSEFIAEHTVHGVREVEEAWEVPISDAMLRILGTIHNTSPPLIPVFTEEFQTPVSDGTLRNFDNTASTRADFCFQPRINPYPGTNPAYYGLFVEAKPIFDGKLTNYMGKGLVKFLRGEYAWAMTQGIMVAYVRPTNNDLPDALVNYFDRHGNYQKYALKDVPKFWSADRSASRPCISVHGREWHYPNSEGKLPGDIEITHLWLRT